MTQKQKNDILVVAGVLLLALALVKIILPAMDKTTSLLKNVDTATRAIANKAHVDEYWRTHTFAPPVDTIRATK